MSTKKMCEMTYQEYEVYWANKSLPNSQKIMKKLHYLIGLGGKILKIALTVSFLFWFSFTLGNAQINGQITGDQAFGLIFMFALLWTFVKLFIQMVRINNEYKNKN